MSNTRKVDVTLRMMGQPTTRFELTCAADARFELRQDFEIVSERSGIVIKTSVREVTNRSNGTTSVSMMVLPPSNQTFAQITSALHAMPEVSNLRIE